MRSEATPHRQRKPLKTVIDCFVKQQSELND